VELPAGWEQPQMGLGGFAACCSAAPAPDSRSYLKGLKSEAFDEDESVDSMLAEFDPGRESLEDDEPACERGSPGLIERLLAPFTGRKARQAVEATPVLDRDACRRRARDLLQALSASPTDAPSRLTVLRSLVRGLEELVRGLRSAGDKHPSVERLGEVLLRLQVFLGRGRFGAAVHALWAQTEAALQAWLAAEAPPAPPPRREGFWK
jgi:hypothetical protein